jgi:DNA-binding protein H-NS
MALKTMSIDKLMELREKVEATLVTKVAEERRSLQSRLTSLERAGLGGGTAGHRGGVRGKVEPKYRNPENPAETWAGRGLKPRWLAIALKSGKKIEDFSIAGPAKKPVAKRATKSAKKSKDGK